MKGGIINWVREVFDYEDGWLIWKEPLSNRVSKGDKAGGRHDRRGYIRVGYNGKAYYAHRLIYAWHNNDWPPLIDHINQNTMDNRIQNLRALTKSQNCLNSNISRGATPYRGVSFYKRKNKFMAEFRGKKLGAFETALEASNLYEKTRKNYFKNV